MEKLVDYFGFAIGSALVLALIMAAILIFPALLIWAINTLFAMEIAYTFWNMLAALTILILFNGN
jgi:hypothetical protein